MRAAHRVLVCSCMALLWASSIASAQIINGTVVLPDGTTPVSGAIVMALDANGATVVRGLTTGRGTFILKLPAPRTVDLRLLRIGYKPLRGPSVTVAAGETKSVTVVYDAATVSLAAVNIRERETCRVQADSGSLCSPKVVTISSLVSMFVSPSVHRSNRSPGSSAERTISTLTPGCAPPMALVAKCFSRNGVRRITPIGSRRAPPMV